MIIPEFITKQSPHQIATKVILDTINIPLDSEGYLRSVSVFTSSNLNPSADMFVSVSLGYWNNTVNFLLDDGYISNPGGGGGGVINWFGKQPIDRETQLRLTHLNGSGEDQKIIVQFTIERPSNES